MDSTLLAQIIGHQANFCSNDRGTLMLFDMYLNDFMHKADPYLAQARQDSELQKSLQNINNLRAEMGSLFVQHEHECGVLVI